MDIFLKICAGVLIAAILSITLQKQEKNVAILLVCLVCCMAMGAAASFLEPVIQFLEKLKVSANLDSEMVTVLFKAVGIGLVGEVTQAICTDSGNAAMGKAIQIVTTAVILWLSLPMFTALMELVEEVLGQT